MSDQILWRGSATNPIATACAGALLFITLAAAAGGRYGSALVALAGTIAATPFTILRVRITSEAFELTLGPWGWPNERYAIDRIEWVESLTVRRRDVRLGVGVRGSDRVLTGRGYLLRPGDALKFQGEMGKRLTVTVDGAPGAVAVMEQLIAGTSDGNPSAEST